MCVLIVDDEKELRESLSDLIKLEFNFDVTLASNGKEALEYCRLKKFDLLVVDYRMPLMDGADFFKILNKEKNPNINSKILFLSGFVDEIHLEIKDTLSIEFKSKPINPEDILNFIFRAYESRQVAA